MSETSADKLYITLHSMVYSLLSQLINLLSIHSEQRRCTFNNRIVFKSSNLDFLASTNFFILVSALIRFFSSMYIVQIIIYIYIQLVTKVFDHVKYLITYLFKWNLNKIYNFNKYLLYFISKSFISKIN